MGALLILAVTFGLMWVLFILPQQRRVKAHQALVATIGVGDEVMTTAGLFGTIVTLDADSVELEIARGVVVRFARAAIARRVDQTLDASDGDTSDGDTVADETAVGADPSGDGAVAGAIRPRRGVMRRRSPVEPPQE